MPAITVQGLSKKYCIKHDTAKYQSLREEIAAAVRNAVSIKSWRTKQSAKYFREDFWALKDINFEVNQGDRLGIIGSNGAGKSTLLKLLSRITEPTTGRIKLNGRVSSLLEVGTGFHPELSGRENIYLNGAILGMRKDEIRRKFDEIVDFAEIEKFLDTPVKRYSSGMYVRLAFAVAGHLEPDILVVDEVLAVGDAKFQKRCLGRMEELSRLGRTILFVTHNMDAMLALCNRGLVIDRGGLVFDGAPLEARQHYLSLASSVEYSMKKNTNRGGSGGVCIETVDVVSSRGVSEPIVSGEPTRLHLTARAEGEYCNRSDLQVAFGIDTIEGQRLYTVLSSWDNTEIDVISGVISVACDLETTPLVPGRYLISATVLFQMETLDSVQHCASFEVIPRVRNVHVERAPGWGVLDLPCRFQNLK